MTFNCRGKDIDQSTPLGNFLASHQGRKPGHDPKEHQALLSNLKLRHSDSIFPFSSNSNGQDSHSLNGQERTNENEDEKMDNKRNGRLKRIMKLIIWSGKPLWNDMGLLAAVVQFFAATTFYISTM